MKIVAGEWLALAPTERYELILEAKRLWDIILKAHKKSLQARAC